MEIAETYEGNSFVLCFYHSCMEKSQFFRYDRSYNKNRIKEIKQN